MLHFMPVAPLGQVESLPNVHFTEHTGWPIMSNELVQTPLSHSVDVSLAVVHAAPNVRGGGPEASAGGESPEHAASASDHARASGASARPRPEPRPEPRT